MGMKADMDYETLRKSMTVQDAARVLRDTNCYGTMDIAKNVILEALEQQSRWIPVSESMPLIGQDVLVCDLDGDMYITYLHLNGTWGFEYCGNKIKNVVAWQELPSPYKPQERDDESCDEIWEKAYKEREGKKMNELTKIKQRILERIEIYIGDIELVEELTEDEKTIFKSMKNIILEEFDRASLEAPTNTAKWVVAGIGIDCLGHGFKEYKCSKCGNIDLSHRKNKFCPECGRRMKG